MQAVFLCLGCVSSRDGDLDCLSERARRERIAALFVDRWVRYGGRSDANANQQMEFVMTGRSMFLASALMAVGGVWAGSAGAAPIHADMSLQGSGLVEQVQHRGGGHGPSMGGSRGGGSMSMGRSGGSSMSFGRSGGGNWSSNRAIGSSNRAIGGSNFGANSRQSFAATDGSRNWSGNNWSGRRHSGDFRRHRGFRGPTFAFGFGPSYYDYGYDYGYDYYPYDDGAYAYVAPGVADDSVGYCEQRYQSYDPSTGTYLGYDGLRHPCP
jgi:hypothetical protein